jgi:tetratricopeptide (TPR) repeat protein
MSAAALLGRLRTSRSPATWWAATIACRLARRLSRNRSRWSSRLGYALERLDQARQARAEAAVPRGWWAWRSRARGPAGRQLRLARRLELRQDWAGAAAAYREAVDRDGSRPVWWYRLGRCRLAAGDTPGAAEAIGRACQLGGADHPPWRVRLADLHDHAGEWLEARRILRENVAQHPRHARSHRRLGEISVKLTEWRGGFTGTLPGRSGGRFQPDPDARSAAKLARQALERTAELEPARTGWRVPLAEARLADGDLAGAAELYQEALREAEESTGRWVLAMKQRWQFQLESIHHRLGRPRVVDPLFECTVEPGRPMAGSGPVVGLFTARTTFAGLAITGFLAAGEADHVEVWLDGVRLRAVNLGGDGFFPQFGLEIRRSTLASFPRSGELEVRSGAGHRLRAPGGADQLRVRVPHGSGQLAGIIAAGGKLDKKGVISPSLAETRLRQQRYLEIYAQAREFFEKELGRPLFLMYGTLLGLHRDGDFIPGDDDFDAGYVSERTDPRAVKEETKDIVIELLRAGFTISFNRRGRLFRLQLERDATDGFHLDVRPVWFQGGRVWVHNHCSFPSSREEFLPVAERMLRGVPVSVPRDTESFLRGHYGPGWKVPDPGFMYYQSEIDPAVLDNLGKALITVREYRELAARVRREVGDDPPAGRLVSVGSQDLYPLDDYLA